MDLYMRHYHGTGSSSSSSYQSTYRSATSANVSSHRPTADNSHYPSRSRGNHGRRQPIVGVRSGAASGYVPGSYIEQRTRSSSSGGRSRPTYTPGSYLGSRRSSSLPGSTFQMTMTPPSKPNYATTPATSRGTPRVIVAHGPSVEHEPVMADAFTERVLSPRSTYDNYADDEVYFNKMQDILSAYPCMGVPPEPSPILGSVYVGTSSNAENFRILKSNKISYVLNCAGGNPVEFRRLREMYAPDDTGIMGYEELPIEDRESCNLRDYFGRAHKFIDFARGRNGRVLICCPGVSRSGAIAVSYLIANGTPLLEAVKSVKHHRRVALCNVGFMKQLVKYARVRGMLDSGVFAKKTEQSDYMRGLLSSNTYSTKFDRHRYYSTSMPRIIKKAY